MNLLKLVTIIIRALLGPFTGKAMNASAEETGQIIEFRQINKGAFASDECTFNILSYSWSGQISFFC